MTGQQILTADLLDILFEHRNKNYGAYQLRRTYAHRLISALFFTFVILFGLLLLIPKGKEKVLPPAFIPGEIYLDVVDVDMPPPVETPPPPPSQAAAPAVSQVEFKTIVIAPDPEVTDLLPTQDDMSASKISGVTTPGAADVGLVPPVNAGTGNAAAPAEEVVKPVINSYSAPEFPGGSEAWLRFLGRHLRAPGDMAIGEKKQVLIRFLVSASGSITQFEVVQSGGQAFDDEVIRVLKKMPKWKPALQNGQPVSKTFTQPVTFVQQEE